MSSLRRRVLASHKLNRLRTAWRGLLHPCPEPNFTFIFGCQRSGTTLLRHLIGLDSRVQDYGEGDPPYFWQVPNEDPRYIRLRDDEEIERLRRKERSPIVLLKPLHDTQCARHLLDRWPNSRAIFIHRHYRQVILSHLNYYRGRYEPMAYISDLLQLQPQSWKAQNLDPSMADFVRQHGHLADNASNRFALLWLARNSLRFSQNHARLIGLGYASLVEQPQRCLQILGAHLGLTFPAHLALIPQERLRDQALPQELAPPLLEACELMMQRLNEASALP